MVISLELAKPADFKAIRKLYQTAFPREERAPFPLLKMKASQGKAEVFSIKASNSFAGFMYLVTRLDLSYLFFFAVDPAFRGQGIGQAALTLLQDSRRGQRIVLAREQLDNAADNYELRVRRRNFYLRCGFSDLPFQIQEASVVYDAMSNGTVLTPEEYDALMTDYMGKWLTRLVGIRMIPKQEASEGE